MLAKYPNLLLYSLKEFDTTQVPEPLVSHFNQQGIQEFLRNIITNLFAQCIFSCFFVTYLKDDLEPGKLGIMACGLALVGIHLAAQYTDIRSMQVKLYLVQTICLNIVYIAVYQKYCTSFFENCVPNYITIKLIANIWYYLYLLWFIQQDLEDISFKKGIKGLLVISIAFILVIFYFKQGDPESLEQTLKVILICTFESFVLILFLLNKIFRLLNLKIGMKNQLGSMRYDKDVILGSMSIFTNNRYAITFLGTELVSFIYLFYF